MNRIKATTLADAYGMKEAIEKAYCLNGTPESDYWQSVAVERLHKLADALGLKVTPKDHELAALAEAGYMPLCEYLNAAGDIVGTR